MGWNFHRNSRQVATIATITSQIFHQSFPVEARKPLKCSGCCSSSYRCCDGWSGKEGDNIDWQWTWNKRVHEKKMKNNWNNWPSVAILITLCHGIGLGWLSPMLPKLQSELDTPLDFVIDVNEASWLGSVISLGGVTGNFFFSFIMNRFGRKVALYGMALPNTVSL